MNPLRKPRSHCFAACAGVLLATALAGTARAQWKLPVPGTGGSGTNVVTAPTEPMSAEGHGGGTQAAAVAYVDFPASLTARTLRQDGPDRISASVLRVNDLVNLALNRPSGTPLEAGTGLVLQIGDDSPATARLAIVDASGLSQPIVIAAGQKLDIATDKFRRRGLVKLQFQAVGGILGGSVQFVTHTSQPAGTLILGAGHGHLEVNVSGVREAWLLNSAILRAELRAGAVLRQ